MPNGVNAQYADLILNQEIVNEMSVTILNALKRRKGIFREGLEKYIPQFNLPKEIEHNPKRKKPKKQLEAAHFLWTSAFLERRSLSTIINRNTNRTWTNTEAQWIFDPKQTCFRTKKEIKEVLKKELNFNLESPSEEPAEERYYYNAKKLTLEQNGDPRKLVNGLYVSEARERLMEYKGIGTGIANLFIIQMLDRSLVKVKDIESIRLKVDIHKGRLLVNTGAIDIKENQRIHQGAVTLRGEEMYLKACQDKDLDASKLDAAAWVVGSKVCNKRDYSFCKRDCPLVDKICKAYTPEDDVKGIFIIYDFHGDRIDQRQKQQVFEFGKEKF
tara:strand:+ start:603 stop:1589 length:987 start_codon:yes stop_codon:yes gene_type:complete